MMGTVDAEAEAYARLMAEFEALKAVNRVTRARRIEAWRARDPEGADMLVALLEVDEEEELPLDKRPSVGSLESLLSDADTKPEPISPAAIGEVLGRYELVGVLGKGGMGVVYDAVHTEVGRPAAIKVLDPVLAEDAAYVARFFAEARIVNDVRHPHIIDIFDLIETDSPRRVALVMERIDGPTLAEMFRARALSIEEVMHVSFQLIDALTAVHEKDIVHRDLKPENVMSTAPLDQGGPSPQVKLLDFGIAKIPEPEQRTATGAWMGTPTYMAPEQFSAAPVSPATDVYGLAELVLEMLTQRIAFEGEGLEVLRRKMSDAPPDFELPTELSARDLLEDVLRACLKVDPAARPSLLDLSDALYLACPEVGAHYRAAPGSAPTIERPALAALESSAALPTGFGRAPIEDGRVVFVGALRRRWLQIALLLLLGIGLGFGLTMRSPSEAPEAQAELPLADKQPPPPPQVLFDLPPPTPLPFVIYDDDHPHPPFGAMGLAEKIEIDPEWRDQPHTGTTCLRVSFPHKQGWAGAVWGAPGNDWGHRPGGYAPVGADYVSFWARGHRRRETLRFGVGLIGPDVPYFDTALVTRDMTITSVWREYRIDLQGQDLRRLKIPFFLVVGHAVPTTVYLDDIRFVKRRE